MSNTLLVLAAALFSLLLGEAALRLFITPPVPSIPHRIYHHTRPESGKHRWASPVDEFDHTHRFNSLRLRGPEPDLGREKLWVVMGDSMIEALQVSEAETFCSLLEKGVGENCCVLNAGVGGYSPILIQLRFRELLDQLAPRIPDRLLVALFPNDLEEEYLYRSMAYQNAQGKVIAVTPRVLRGRLGGVQVAFFEHCRIWRLVRSLISSPEEDAIGPINPVQPSERILYPFRRRWTEIERSVWSDLFRSIGDLDLLCREKGVKLELLLIPPGHQVSPEAWKTGKQKMGFDSEAWIESRTFQDEAINRARRLGIPTLDLLPLLREHPTPESLYFDEDGHWTPAGNRFVAEQLAPLLVKENTDAPTEP